MKKQILMTAIALTSFAMASNAQDKMATGTSKKMTSTTQAKSVKAVSAKNKTMQKPVSKGNMTTGATKMSK
jgi:hypothetical protein